MAALRVAHDRNQRNQRSDPKRDADAVQENRRPADELRLGGAGVAARRQRRSDADKRAERAQQDQGPWCRAHGGEPEQHGDRGNDRR